MAIDDAKISLVLSHATALARHSWELGTAAQAILEWTTPSLAIWNNPFPGGEVPTLDPSKIPALAYIKPSLKTDGDTLVDGEGAAGDSASVGVFAIMIGKSDGVYWEAAVRQYLHLVNEVPRWGGESNGAISHREEPPAELWADFVYMVPPFLAYYAVAAPGEEGLKLAQNAADQVIRYSKVLRTPSGAWQHIAGGHRPDPGLWSTSNGWAAAGAARVLATLRMSNFDSQTKDRQNQLKNIIKGIIDGARNAAADGNALLRNYLDGKGCPEGFGEISGTSLLAATVFRMAVLEPDTFGDDYKSWATSKMNAVDALIDQDGIAKPAVNPLNGHDSTPLETGSPEGQAFVVLMHAAHRDLTSETV